MSVSFITPIYKKNSMYDKGNYRGISVNSVMAKIFSSVLNNRLVLFLNNNKILNDCQIGFVPKARTSDHMFILKTLQDKLSKNRKLYTCFVDFKKAYNSVWRSYVLQIVKL